MKSADQRRMDGVVGIGENQRTFCRTKGEKSDPENKSGKNIGRMV
jgi:hypothetical protein